MTTTQIGPIAKSSGAFAGVGLSDSSDGSGVIVQSVSEDSPFFGKEANLALTEPPSHSDDALA